jgi:hypothetical protein
VRKSVREGVNDEEEPVEMRCISLNEAFKLSVLSAARIFTALSL